jgi:uncharacterized damage-inducible protein DinB
MSDHPFAISLGMHKAFFLRSIGCFRPADAGFTPAAGMFTVAGQIAHAALTVDWFIAGAFSPSGFDMNFAAHEAEARQITTLEQAIGRFTASYDAASARFAAATMADLNVPIAAGPIMGGAPRLAVVEAMADHTAHHRGALTVYARMLGLTPAMPYA